MMRFVKTMPMPDRITIVQPRCFQIVAVPLNGMTVLLQLVVLSRGFSQLGLEHALCIMMRFVSTIALPETISTASLFSLCVLLQMVILSRHLWCLDLMHALILSD